MAESMDRALMSIGINVPGKLMQFGVKGQRWGVRKPRGAGPGPASKAASPKKPAGTKAPKKAPKSVKKMSDQELKKILTRLENERKYAQLTAPKVNAAHQFVKTTLLNVGKQEATKFASKAGAVLVSQAMGEILKQVSKNPNASKTLINILKT